MASLLSGLGSMFGGGAGAGAGGAGAGAAGGFTAGNLGGASSIATGSSAFGGGVGGAAGGAAGGLGGLAAPASAGFGTQLMNFGLGALNPAGGQSAQNIGAAQSAGRSPAFGDIVSLIAQQLLNQELQRGLGPAFTPLNGYAQGRQRLSRGVPSTWGSRPKQTD